MDKRWFIILILAAALTAFSFALSRRDSSDWRSTRARRIFPFPWQDAAGIAITRPDGRATTLVKSPDGEWRLVLSDDVQDVASFALIDELAALSTLAWREPATVLAAPNPELAVRIAAVSQLDQKVELLLGELKNNQRAATVDNATGTVYAINQELLKFLDWPDERYRNLLLLGGGPGRRPHKIALVPGGGNPDLAIELALTGSEWNITRPIAWPADSQRVDLLLGWASRLQANAIVAENTGAPETFGLADDSPRVRFEYRRDEDVFSRTIVFGAAAENPDEIYARVTQRSPVFTVPRQALSEIALDTAAEYPESWVNYLRQRSLDLIGGRQPVSITVECLLPLPTKLTLEQPRDRDAGKWLARLETRDTDETFAVDAPSAGDPSRPLGMLLSGLSRLRVRNFLADAAPGPETIAWTSHPAWRIGCRFADGSSSPALTIYAADDQGTLPPGRAYDRGLAAPQEMTTQSGLAFSLQGIPAVMESHPDAAHLLCLPLYRYRSRKIVDSDPRRWGRVEIRSAGGVRSYQRDSEGLNEQWWLAGERPEPLLDGNNLFVGILLQVSQLRAEAYVAHTAGEPAEFGLDQPDVTAIVYGLDSAREGEDAEEAVFRLDIGAKSHERVDERYARLNGAGPVFLIPDTLAQGLSAVYE